MVELKMTPRQYAIFKSRLLYGVANDLVNALVRNCPKGKTGHLQESIAVVKDGSVLKIQMAEHWKYLEFGTPPHIIEAKGKANGGADALAFSGSGGDLGWRDGKRVSINKVNGKTVITNAVLRKKVHHPGTRPQPFIRNTLRNQLQGIIENNLKRLTE